MNYLKIIWRLLLLTGIIDSFTINHASSQNLVKNPGFETGNLSPYWGSWPIGSSFADIDTNNAFEGEFCAKLAANEVYFYQPVNLEPNTTYKISAAIKSESVDNIWFGVSNVNSEGGKGKYFNDTNYKTDSLFFTTDESPGNTPNIFVWKDAGTGIVWVDNIVLTKYPQITNPKPPGGFGIFYVSSQGNDSNTGTSPGQAWQTIDKVNSIDFGPGDRILFEGDETFNGTIVLNQNDYGTLTNKVHFGSYGTGRATINAQTGSGLIAYDCSNIEIKNLNFTGNGRLYGNTGNGIIFSFCSDILIDSVDISGFQHSGLMVNSIGENYQITNVDAHDNGYSGIYVEGMDKTLLSNIYLGYCTADNNPGDPTVLNNHSGNGIFAYNTSNITIEFCEASNNGWDMPRLGNGPGGIWVAEVDSAIIQNCISHDNKTSDGGLDGLGFDLDGGTTNSIIQYCLSYNNEGAGYGIFQYAGATDWYNNAIRYCISENDGNISAAGSVVVWHQNSVNQFQGLEFHNNVIYNANGPAMSFSDHRNSNFNFRNNIFVSAQKSVNNGITTENFQGNCWYSLSGDFIIGSPPAIDFNTWALDNNKEMLNGEIVGMFADPGLINPGNSNLNDPKQMADINDYKVQDASVVIDAGLDLYSLFNVDPGVQDYFGNLIKQGTAFDIGVNEYIDTTLQDQQLNLIAGWNIISFRVMPSDSDLLNILQPLIDEGKLKKVMDEKGNIIEDWGELNGGWHNTIGDLQISEGYKINVTLPASLEILGLRALLPFNIPLNEGWNIISWPASNEQNGMFVFQELIDTGKLKKVMDEEGNIIEDWGEANGGWKNFIGNLKPGEGYKVNVTVDCILTVYETGTKSTNIISERKPSTHFIHAFKGNGTDHMNINLVNLAESGINEGDEIGVFDGDICVGSTQIINNNLSIINNQFSVSIPVSATDGIEKNNGYSVGNPISVKLFRNGKEYPLTVEPLNNGKVVFVKGSSLFAMVDVSTGVEELFKGGQTEVKYYPNPFNDYLNIELYLSHKENLVVEVYDAMGRKIKVLYNEKTGNGKIKLSWDGTNNTGQKVVPGVYLIKLNENWSKVIRK